VQLVALVAQPVAVLQTSRVEQVRTAMELYLVLVVVHNLVLVASLLLVMVKLLVVAVLVRPRILKSSLVLVVEVKYLSITPK
jgi:hypothetical protein